MIAMTPVLARGYTAWDKGLLPADEIEERLRAVRDAMRGASLDVLLVCSANYHSNGNVAYLAGWPLGGVLVLPRDGAPRLCASAGGREMHFQSGQTGVQLVSAGNAPGPAVAAFLAETGIAAGRAGCVATDILSAAAYDGLRDALRGFELVAFDEAYATIRGRKRPREVRALALAGGLAARAAAAGEAVFAAGGSTAEALVEAERIARNGGARDFRGLANIGGKGLRPFAGLSGGRAQPLLLWVGVDHHGYWGAAANSGAAAPEGEAERAMAAMLAAAAPGVTAGALAEAALARLSPAGADLALSYGLGAGIGLELDEPPFVRPGETTQLAPGMVLSLQVVVPASERPSLAARTVEVTEGGIRPL